MVNVTDNKVVVGVFADPGQAEQALHELHLAGFPDDHIRCLVRQETTLDQTFQAGRTIVIVQADERPLEAFAILKRGEPDEQGVAAKLK